MPYRHENKAGVFTALQKQEHNRIEKKVSSYMQEKCYSRVREQELPFIYLPYIITTIYLSSISLPHNLSFDDKQLTPHCCCYCSSEESSRRHS